MRARTVLTAAVFAAGAATLAAHAQDVRQLRDERLSDVVNKEFGCSLTLPFRKQSKSEDNPSRVGVVHTTFTREALANGSDIYRLGKDKKEWCAPTSDLPEGSEGASLDGYRYYQGASASVKIEAGKLFSLLNLGAEDIREVKIDIRDVKHYELNSRRRRAVVRELLAAESCKPAVIDNRAQMVLGTCTGTVTVQIYFNRAFTLKALAIKLAGLEVSAEAGWRQELGEVVPCTVNSSSPGVKGTKAAEPAGAKSEAKGKTAENAKDAKKSETKEGDAKDATKKAADGAKKAADNLEKAADVIRKAADAVKAAAPKSATPAAPAAGGDNKGAADAKGKAEVDAKCHQYVKLTSPEGAVFGIALSERGALKSIINDIAKQK